MFCKRKRGKRKHLSQAVAQVAKGNGINSIKEESGKAFVYAVVFLPVNSITLRSRLSSLSHLPRILTKHSLTKSVYMLLSKRSSMYGNQYQSCRNDRTTVENSVRCDEGGDWIERSMRIAGQTSWMPNALNK